jgi:hypothetical protein
MLDAILTTLRETWSGYVGGLRLVVPRLLAMLSVVAVGWLIAAGARVLVGHSFRFMRIGRLAERTGAAELLRKAELPSADRLVASGTFWILFLGFLLAGLDALGLQTIGVLRGELSNLMPRVVGSLLILAVGLVVANVVRRVVLLGAVTAGWPHARGLGGAVYALLVTVAVAMALDHLGLARPIVLAAFGIVVGAGMLSLAVAVGIGAGPIVRRFLEEQLAPGRRPESDGSSHL